MKTLVNKNNPAIRITAPEIVLSANKEEYWIAGIPQRLRTYLAKDWTLVEEEPVEWNEDDEDNLCRVIRVLEDNDSDWEELSNWLKSLRPQPKK